MLACDLLDIPADLAGKFDEIHRIFDQWIANEGNQGIKRAKDLFSYTLSYLLGESPPTLNWIAMSKSIVGSPKILENVWQWVLNNPRSGLTMLRYSDLFPAILDDESCLKALDSITSPSVYQLSEVYENQLLNIANQYRTKLRYSSNSVPMFTKGPNGISILSVHRDAIALQVDGILDSVKDLRERVALESEYFVSDGKDFFDSESVAGLHSGSFKHFGVPKQYQNVVSGRIVFLAEKSAKIRVIAQGDYLSQATLKPIHDALAGILRKIPEDWTFDQEGGKEWVRKKTTTAKWSASFDLSNATDRLPLDLQAKIIDRVLPGNLGPLWAKVIGDRQFKYTLPSGIEGFVRYAVGQPMGFFSSFVSFALLHHLVVKLAFEIAHGRPGKNFYAIIGDDMVIFDQAAGDVYKNIISSIGGIINLTKSRVSNTKGDIRAEFAKAYFRNGISFTPFSLKEMKAALENWANVPNLYTRLHNSLGIVIHTRKLKVILQEYWPNEVNTLVQLLEVPILLGGFGKPGHTPLVQVLRGTSNLFRRFLAYRALEAYKTVINISIDDISKAYSDIDGRSEFDGLRRSVMTPFLSLLRDRNASLGISHIVTSRRGFLDWAMSEDTPLSALVDCVTLMVKELPTSLREKVRRPSIMWVRASADDKRSSESAIDSDQSMFNAFDYLAATA